MTKIGQLELSDVTLILGLPTSGIVDVEKQGRRVGPAMWHFMVPETVASGEWHLKIQGYLNGFDNVELQATVPIAAGISYAR